MDLINGRDQDADEQELEHLAARDTKRIAERELYNQQTDARATSVIESTGNKAPPSQSSHDLMLKSVDHIAEQWVGQLKQVRANTEAIEQMVLTAVSRAKHDLTQLHLLGAAVQAEAKRGEEVCSSLAGKIEQLMQERAR